MSLAFRHPIPRALRSAALPLLLAAATAALAAVRAGPAAAQLADGDVVVGDLAGHRVLAVDTKSGRASVVSAGDQILRPWCLAISPDGAILTLNFIQGILRIDPATGRQRMAVSGPRYIMDFVPRPDGRFYLATADVEDYDPHTSTSKRVALLLGTQGIDLDSQGNIVAILANHTIVRINPDTGLLTPVSPGLELMRPSDIAVGPDGNYYIADVGGLTADSRGGILRINVLNGEGRWITRGIDWPGLANVGFTNLAFDQSGQLLALGSNLLAFVDLVGGDQRLVPIQLPDPHDPIATRGLAVHGVAKRPDSKVPLGAG